LICDSSHFATQQRQKLSTGKAPPGISSWIKLDPTRYFVESTNFTAAAPSCTKQHQAAAGSSRQAAAAAAGGNKQGRASSSSTMALAVAAQSTPVLELQLRISAALQ